MEEMEGVLDGREGSSAALRNNRQSHKDASDDAYGKRMSQCRQVYGSIERLGAPMYPATLTSVDKYSTPHGTSYSGL